MKKNPSYLSDKKMMLRAVGDAFAKLDPRVQIKNPVMFLVYVSAILTSILFVCALFGVKDAGLSAGFILAIAGSMVEKKHIAESAGTLSTSNGMFVFLLIFIVMLIGALSFFPALALGPIAEHFLMLG